MKPKSKPGGAKKSAIQDLEPRADPRGGFDLAANPISDGSVIDKAQFPAVLKVTPHKQGSS